MDARLQCSFRALSAMGGGFSGYNLRPQNETLKMKLNLLLEPELGTFLDNVHQALVT